MDLDEYQKSAMRTAGDLSDKYDVDGNGGLITSALGLAGEAGEFSDIVKKWWAHGHPLDVEKLDKEAGDVLWYLARYAAWRKKSLTQLAHQNIDKLRSRYPNGFETSRSMNRTEGPAWTPTRL